MAEKNKKPTLLFDGECDFCRGWIERWRKMTRGKITYAPYQEALPNFPQLTKEQCAKAVQLILPDGSIYAGAHAVFKSLALAGKCGWLFWSYEHLPLFGALAEITYQWVSRHRAFLSKLAK